MAGYKNFQTDENKHVSDLTTKKDDLNQNNKKDIYKTKSEKFDAKAHKWISFWRANLHRFAQDMGIRLFTSQKIMLFLMDKFPMFMYIASRGTGKSFIIALYSILRCILYPDTIITIAASTKQQGILMISQYVKYFYDEYPLIANEIELINEGNQRPECKFKNTSKIIVVTPNDNARGHRTNVLVLEEFPLIKKDILDSVLKRFASTARKPAFTFKPEYKDFPQEPNRELYISSARYKSEWGWETAKAYLKDMVKNKHDYYHGIFATNYELPLDEGIYEREKIKRDMESSDFDPIKWSMEMDTMWFGENENSLFKFKDFENNRKIMQTVYPNEHHLFIGKKKIPQPIKKRPNEINILAIDVAVTNKSDSDNTIIGLITAKETKKGYIRQLRYPEAINGEKITEQALRIKQSWHDFNVDYIVLDIRNCGLDLYGLLTKETYDPERNITYPAMICFNDDDYKDMAYEKDGLTNIFSIAATQDLNDKIARNFNATLKANKFEFLINENDARNMFQEQDESYMLKDVEDRLKIEYPYIQTTIAINEIINTEMIVANGKIKIKEVGGARKDRYSSISYGNYFISILEYELMRKEELEDVFVIVL